MEAKEPKKKSKGCLIAAGIFILFVVWYDHTGSEAREAKAGPLTDCFSAWDGSCMALVKATKQQMNDPGSFEHVETRYIDRGSEIDVIMKFRGKNAFGGVVANTVTGTVNADCILIKGPVGF